MYIYCKTVKNYLIKPEKRQSEMVVKFKKLSPTAQLPRYAYSGDAGMDVFSNEDHQLKAGERHTFNLGLSSDFPSGYVVLVWDKGGLGAKGIHCFSGVIDAGYRGEWIVVLWNSNDQDYAIGKGDKIAQVLIQNASYPFVIH